MYTVKEIFATLQGEGAQTGRVAVFLRFAGCNLWSGLERDRESAACRFCDTDFVGADGPGGGKFQDAAALADAVAQCWDGAIEGYPSPLPLSRKGRGDVPCGEGYTIAAGTHPLPLRERVAAKRPGEGEQGVKPYVVCTGGEPLLQLDGASIEALHRRGFEVAIETNGTRPAPPALTGSASALRPARRSSSPPATS